MAAITVSTVIERSPAEVWADVRNIASHVEWMADAETITFTSDQTEGTGTTFECLTKVGPIRLIDKMEITEWVDERTMGVRHTGLVTGTGEFTLTPLPGGGTEFSWSEDLVFPLWMGGPLGGVVGGQIMKLIWNRNLSGLRDRFS